MYRLKIIFWKEISFQTIEKEVTTSVLFIIDETYKLIFFIFEKEQFLIFAAKIFFVLKFFLKVS